MVKTDQGEITHNKLRKVWLYTHTLPLTMEALQLKVDPKFLAIDEGYVDISKSN